MFSGLLRHPPVFSAGKSLHMCSCLSTYGFVHLVHGPSSPSFGKEIINRLGFPVDDQRHHHCSDTLRGEGHGRLDNHLAATAIRFHQRKQPATFGCRPKPKRTLFTQCGWGKRRRGSNPCVTINPPPASEKNHVAIKRH